MGLHCSGGFWMRGPRSMLAALDSPERCCCLFVLDGQIANPAQVLPSVYQSAQALFGSGANKAGQPLSLKIASKTIPGDQTLPPSQVPCCARS